MDDVQTTAMYASGAGALALAAGEHDVALAAAKRAIDGALSNGLPLAHEVVRLSLPDAIDAAIAVGNLEEADRLLDVFANHPRGAIPQFLRAQVIRARALVASARGDNKEVEEDLVAAETSLRSLGYPVWVAVRSSTAPSGSPGSTGSTSRPASPRTRPPNSPMWGPRPCSLGRGSCRKNKPAARNCRRADEAGVFRRGPCQNRTAFPSRLRVNRAPRRADNNGMTSARRDRLVCASAAASSRPAVLVVLHRRAA